MKKLELSPQNFRYNVLHMLYSGLTTLLTRWDIQNSNFIIEPIFGRIFGHFWAQQAKNRPKNQNCSVFTIFHVEKFFAHNFFHFFSEWQSYILGFFSF